MFLFDDSHTVLHHHNGVVHQRPDHKDQSEHGKNVHGVAQRNEKHESSDQGDGDRRRGNQRCAPVLKEDIGDRHHKDKCDDQRFNNFFYCCADVFGRVIPHLVVDAFRETLGELFQRCVGFRHNAVRVRIVIPVDRHGNGRFAVERTVAGIGFGTEFYAGDIRQTRDISVRSDFHHDILKLLRSLETSERVDFQLDILVAALRADRTGGGLNVLVLNRRGNVLRFDIERGHAERIQPDAHTV